MRRVTADEGAAVAEFIRDEAAAELRGFWRDFTQVAKIALEDQPQQREILGLLERS